MTQETIAGRYVVVRAIGRGGMGTVWLCRDAVLGREVAVKQVGALPDETVPDPARALREARSLAALNHRHVVSVFDAIQADGHIWLIMEYVPGETLSELIAREGRLDPARVCAIGAQVADGLAAAHARGTVHRDVKPGNVLIAGDVAKISDFGIARTEGDVQLTRSDVVIGTPQYFSPELARGADPSPAADVWALGATLYHAVEGQPPVADRGNPLATLAAIAETPVRRPTHAGFLADALGRMLDPDPASRWSMADAAHALGRLHEKHRPPGTITAPRTDDLAPRTDDLAPVPTPGQGAAAVRTPPSPAPDRRRSRWPLLVGALVLLLFAGIGLSLLLDRGDPAPSAKDDPGTGDRTTASPGPTGTPEPTEPPRSSTPGTSSPSASGTGSTSSSPAATATSPASAGGRSQAVASYYALLPEDTRSAWEMLGTDAQAQVGGYGKYAAFWRTIDDVSVGEVSADGDLVTVHLTYSTDRGHEEETRRLRVERSDGAWIITEDLGAVTP